MGNPSQNRCGLTLLFLGLFCGSAAHAQTTTTPAGTGTCTGSLTIGTTMVTIAGQTYLAVGAPSATATPLLAGSGTVFGLAECECRSRDIGMGVKMSMQLPQGSTGVAAQMWLGLSACSDPTTRAVMNTQCEQITASSPPGNGSFVLDPSSFKTVGQFSIPIPAESLANPLPVGNTGWPWSCDVSGTQDRTVTIILGPDQMPATCTLPLTIQLTPPTAPDSLSLTSGDSALTATWTIPDGTAGIEYYQLLCRKRNSRIPVYAADSDFISGTRYWFSSCSNGTLYRRPLPGLTDNTVLPAGTTPWYPTPDSGTDIPDGGTDDGGTVDMAASTSDMGTTTLPFPIDPAYICSDRINAVGSTLSQRVENLENGTEYDVMVVSIDTYGNPSPSIVASGRPQATESPLQPFCDRNGGICPTGFGCGCHVTTTPDDVSTRGILFACAAILIFVLMLKRRQAGRAA